MDRNTRVLVAGGDLRQAYLANFLKRKFSVKKYALGEKFLSPELLRGYDILVLPHIVSTDKESLNAPFSEEKIPLGALVDCLKKGGIVFGGRFPENIKKLYESHGFEVCDYSVREEYVIKNCVPTAEGALQIAMEELPVTIRGLKTLVVGFGRVGKITAKLFSDVGADVVATARKHSDLALSEALGIKAQKTSEALSHPEGFELVINTVPSLVIDHKVLEKLPKSCLVIDLASAPGGIDFEAARTLGIKSIRAVSLPSEVTAAKLLLVNRFLEEFPVKLKVGNNNRAVRLRCAVVPAFARFSVRNTLTDTAVF